MKYKIDLLSDWHCGSGLAAGAESDAEVLKDENNHPYIPGKTIKGLLKDALMEMPEANSGISINEINTVFGYEVRNGGIVSRTEKGCAFFSNAVLPEDEKKEVTKVLSQFLYRNITSTSIDENGIADNKRLRTMEVCMPLVLEGTIDNLEKEQEELLIMATKWLRQLGVNRNRGLGRCKIEIITQNNQNL